MGTPAKHGKKRKSTATPTKNAPTSARKSRKLVFEPLSIEHYRPKEAGTRVLSCGEGEQLGHPGRNTTRKPRAIDTFPEGTKFLQVAAGGVHSLVLTEDSTVYSCGINEKGTVPVQGLEAEGSTDRFSEIVFAPEIKQLGKIVQITAGASFSAALTEKGSVIAWGNLRDTQGEVNVHETLKDIQKKPVVVIRHKQKENWHIVKIAAGENHLAMLSNEGELLTFGEGSMGQLGRSVRTEHIRSKFMVDQSGNFLIVRVLEKHQFVRFVDVWARGFWTIGRAQDGRLFACGLNNFGQLGVVPAKEKTPKPRRQYNRRNTQSAQKPATMEALNLDELDISAINQASSEDSSQELDPVEGGESSANDEDSSKEKAKTEEQQKVEKRESGQNDSFDLKLPMEEDSPQTQQNGSKHGDKDVKVEAGKPGESTSAAVKQEKEVQQPHAEPAPVVEKPKIIGQEEANKVALLTWAQAFPADKVWTHASGVQHIVCRTEEGELFGIGKNTDNALGIGTWEGNQDEQHWRYDTLQQIPLPDGVRAAGVDATLGASILWTNDGKVYGFGCDTVGQLGLGIKDEDEKIVPIPRQIRSAHLDGFRVLSVSLADNHALFLATNESEKEPTKNTAETAEMKEGAPPNGPDEQEATTSSAAANEQQ